MRSESLEEKKALCLEINKDIAKFGLAKLTWGNASVRFNQFMIIKPSGVPFDKLEDTMLSVVDIETGEHVGGLRPSVDTDIHLCIYRNYAAASSAMHTHSKFATMFAQAKQPIRLIGTTHADYFPCDIPVTKQIGISSTDAASVESRMGQEVVNVARDHFPPECNTLAVLMVSHGVMLWSSDPKKLVESAIVLEDVAELNFGSQMINQTLRISDKDRELFRFHYDRKHGEGKYYGQ